MTAIVSVPARARAGAHRGFMIVGAIAVALAATAILAFVMLTSSPSSSPATPSVPAEEELTETQRLCQIARVVGC